MRLALPLQVRSLRSNTSAREALSRDLSWLSVLAEVPRSPHVATLQASCPSKNRNFGGLDASKEEIQQEIRRSKVW